MTLREIPPLGAASNQSNDSLASGVRYPPLVVYLEIAAPEEVVIGEPFEITVIARPHGDDADRFEIQRTSSGPIDLEVEITIPESGAVEPLGSLVQPLRVIDALSSARLGFAFIARSSGPLSFSVRADVDEARPRASSVA